MLSLKIQSLYKKHYQSAPESIDILINNAGILHQDTFNRMSRKDIEHLTDQYQVNAVAPLLVTRAANDKLHKGFQSNFHDIQNGIHY